MAIWVIARRARITVWICLACVLAACAGVATFSSTSQNQASPQPGLHGSSTSSLQFMVSGSGALLEAYEAVVSIYQQRHPDRGVDLVGIPDEADFQKRLAADLAAGRPADVIVESYTNIPGLASRGLLAPVAADLAASQVLKLADFAAGSLAPLIFNRQLQCVPLSAAGLVVYYNHALFQAASLPDPGNRWTRQEFLADAQRLTRDTDGDGRMDQYGLGIQPSLTNLAPFILQLKGPLVDLEPWPSELSLGTPMALTATTWLVSLQNEFHVVPSEQDELAASSLQRFMDGSLAMLAGTRALVPELRQVGRLNWDVAPLPADNTSTSNIIVEDGLCMTAAATNKTAAWQFIEFAASPEGQALVAKSGAIVPALSAVAASPVFLDPALRPAHSQLFSAALAHALALPKLENWSDIQAIVDEELGQAFYGHKSVAQALNSATLRSEEYFKIHTAH